MVRSAMMLWVLLITVVCAQDLSVNPANPDVGAVNSIELVNRLYSAGLISENIYRRQRLLLEDTSITQVAAPEQREESPDQSAGKRDGRDFALIFGSDNYSEFEALYTAANDAQAIADLLQDDFGFDVTVLLNPTRREMLSSFIEMRERLRPTDRFLLYYAGHGYLDPVTRRGYWLPVDAELSNPTNWISNVEIADAVSNLPANHVLVIADSCFSGSLATSDQTVAPTDESDDRNTRARFVMTSGGLEPVLDSGFGDHSVFASALLEALKGVKSQVSLHSLFESVRKRVVSVTDQIPQVAAMPYTGHLGGTFNFRRSDG